jgi:aryl-alcohol dehydrogenase-like predicted oxidoreductase
MPTCEEEGLSQIVWSPIAQGVLTGKYLPGEPLPTDSRATDEAGGGSNFVAVAHAIRCSKRCSTSSRSRQSRIEHGAAGIAWVLSNDNVASAIIGASRPEQIEDNLGAVGKRLDADTLAAVDAALGDVVSRDPALTESPNPRP